MLTQNSRKDFVHRWLPVLLWMGLIFFMSSRSKPFTLLPSRWQADCQSAVQRIGLPLELCQNEVVGQVSHFGEYVILAVLALRAIRWNRPVLDPFQRLDGCMAVAFGVVYSFSDEFHQLFVPGRTFQLIDLATDWLGVLVGVGLVWYFSRRRLKIQREK